MKLQQLRRASKRLEPMKQHWSKRRCSLCVCVWFFFSMGWWMNAARQIIKTLRQCPNTVEHHFFYVKFINDLVIDDHFCQNSLPCHVCRSFISENHKLTKSITCATLIGVFSRVASLSMRIKQKHSATFFPCLFIMC